MKVHMLNGLDNFSGQKDIMKMTVEEVIQQMPELMNLSMTNPTALMKMMNLGEFVNGPRREYRNLGSIYKEIPREEWTTHETIDRYNQEGEITGSTTYALEKPFVEIVSEENGQTIRFELVKDDPKFLINGMEKTAKIINRMQQIDYDGITYTNPRMAIEARKIGRNPNYYYLHCSIESSNQPVRVWCIWLLDARKLEDGATIMASSKYNSENYQNTKDIMDSVYLDYHEDEASLWDKLYFDRKFGWD